ncbi:DsbA family protein [Kitasatospora purpeofusca]|uniref:DsbA family protein n=1 Tax=Kitasatospora purpeofusca TaxID=67352 RepID=UPI0036643666
MALGVEGKISGAVLDGVQKSRTITDAASLKEAFVAAAGITPEEYDAAWTSSAVKASVARQRAAAQDFRIQGVPAVYVNGRYLVKDRSMDTSSADSYKTDYAGVVQYLVNLK